MSMEATTAGSGVRAGMSSVIERFKGTNGDLYAVVGRAQTLADTIVGTVPATGPEQGEDVHQPDNVIDVLFQLLDDYRAHLDRLDHAVGRMEERIDS